VTHTSNEGDEKLTPMNHDADCLDLLAMRARKETKMILAPGVTMSAAMEVAVRGLDQSGQVRPQSAGDLRSCPADSRVNEPQGIRERDFIDYLNECDMEEILAPFLGAQGTRTTWRNSHPVEYPLTTTTTGQVNINSRLPQSMMFDPSILSASDFQARAPVKLRDYGQD